MASANMTNAMELFGSSQLWPPLDEHGQVKPILASILLVLLTVSLRIMYTTWKEASPHEKDKRQRAEELKAQMSAILLHQRQHFRLSAATVKRFGEDGVFESADDLVVKSELPVVVEDLCREVNLKGRRLTSLEGASSTQQVSTHDDLVSSLAGIKEGVDVTCTLESEPVEAKRVFELLVDEVFNQDITKLSMGISIDDDRYLDVKALLLKRMSDELDEAVSKTRQAHGLEPIPELSSTKKEGLDLNSYHSGEKLRHSVELAKKVKEHYGSITQTQLAKAQDVMRIVSCSQRGSMMKFWPFLRPALPYVLFGVIPHACLEVVVAKLCTGQMHIMDMVGSGKVDVAQARVLIMQWFTGWCVIILFGWYVTDLFFSRANSIFAQNIKGAVMKAILKQDFEFFDRNPAGKLQERLNRDTDIIIEFFLYKPKEIITESTAIIANAFAVYSMAPFDMFLVAVLPLPVIAICQWCMMKANSRWGKTGHLLGERAAAGTMELLKEIKTVREFSMEKEEAERFIRSSNLRRLLDSYFGNLGDLSHRCMHLLHMLGEGMTLMIGVSRVQDGSMRPAELVTVMMMLSCMIGGKLRGMFERLSDFGRVLEPAARTLDLLERQPKIEPAENGKQGLQPVRFQGSIEFQDVVFRYPTDQRKTVLKGVSFAVRPGQHVALVGHAGCGKSTIFKLLQRFYDPNSGTVLIDGLPIQEYDVHHLRSRISIVAQDNVLFRTSILENIVYGIYPRPTEEEVRVALKQASALAFVEAFPDQLQTRVGDRGVALSGGQRQRVAIARAMVRKPNMLILDEATSALDPVNEKVVQAALDALIATTGASALTIAHRLTTVKGCDKIVVFDDGLKVEEGTHDELLWQPLCRAPSTIPEQKGRLTSGFYREQWESMMGPVKASDEADDVQSAMTDKPVTHGVEPNSDARTEVDELINALRERDQQVAQLRLELDSVLQAAQAQFLSGSPLARASGHGKSPKCSEYSRRSFNRSSCPAPAPLALNRLRSSP